MKTKTFLSVSILLMLIIFSACGGPRLKPTASASEQFAHAKKDYDKKHWLDAVDGFQRVIFNYPGSNIVDTSQYYLAMSYFNNKEYELATVEFRRLVVNYPMSDYTELSRFMAGLCYFENTPENFALDQEDLKRAIEVLRDFTLENPDSKYAVDAKDIIRQGINKLAHKEYENGVLYYKIYDYRAARIYFQYVIDNFTETGYSALALYKISEMDYKEKKYTEAIKHFNHFKTIYPSHEMIEKAQEYIDKISRHLETVDASSGS